MVSDMCRNKKTGKCRLRGWLSAVILMAFAGFGEAGAESTIIPAQEADPHYTKVGFFDIHVCHWPNQPLFFLSLFSSYVFNDLAKVELFTPTKQRIGELDFDKFRLVKKPGKPEKRVFIKHFEIPEGADNGWYQAVITLHDGSRYAAEDYVVIRGMELAHDIQPADGAENVPLPKQLSWAPIPGAKFYQVFIQDVWEGKLVFESKLLAEPVLNLPTGIIQPSGYYSWKIHARDVNQNVLLGDFNHGSLTDPATFSVAARDAAK